MNETAQPPFRIVYDRSRFPVRPRRADGSYGCRGCGGDIPPARQTWCSRECSKKFNPPLVLHEVRKRDQGVCAFCGFDCRTAMRTWLAQPHSRVWKSTDQLEWRKRRPPREEYDHIIPFSEGGMTVLENLRTLCTHCHKKRTKEWRQQKAKKKT